MAKMRLYRALLRVRRRCRRSPTWASCCFAASGKSYALMVTVIGLENLCGGMGTAACVALLMALCDRRFSATQYALLSGAFGGRAASTSARRPGYLVARLRLACSSSSSPS